MESGTGKRLSFCSDARSERSLGEATSLAADARSERSVGTTSLLDDQPGASTRALAGSIVSYKVRLLGRLCWVMFRQHSQLQGGAAVASVLGYVSAA